MTTIAEFSDEPRYTIKNVSRMTDIRTVTLRAWERRYEVLSPSRSSNRYRLYSDRDVAVLRWLKSRLQNGVSISTAVLELRQMTGQGQWPEAVAGGPPLPGPQATATPAQIFRQLYQALLRYDEVESANLLRESLASFDLMTIMQEVLTPCLVQIGEAWYRGEVGITVEHFASTFLRGKLLALLQAYPYRRNAQFIMLGGAPDEQHEIGALMISVLLRSQGYRVEFLGPDLLLEDLTEHARYEKPQMVILTATTREAALNLVTMQNKLSRLRPAPLFGYGGFAFVYEPVLRQRVPGIFLGETMDAAVKKIVGLLPPQGGKPALDRVA
jgi:DNA-binding transcriptional MerR regulator